MTTVTEVTPTSVTVSVPLAIRRRNGRPRIVLPESLNDAAPSSDQAQVTLLRAIARAWHWRRQIESGEATTLSDIAATEKITRPFVSRLIRLAYLSPTVLERLVTRKGELEVSAGQLAGSAVEAWGRQTFLLGTAEQ
jgi:hypothetical protein